MYVRRLSLPALLSALFLLAFGAYAVPARADVDIELIAETLSEEGYYVDSGSKVLRSDSSLDRLRGELEYGNGKPVFVTVLPAGAASPGLSGQLARQIGRKGTYAVLVGDRLEATSTALPQSRVGPMVKRAVAANRGNPEAALIEFTRQLNGRETGKTGASKNRRKTNTARPSPTPTETVQTGVARQPLKEDSGPNLPLIGGIAALVLVAAGGGYLLWRRRRAARQLVPAGGPGMGIGPRPGDQGPYGPSSGPGTGSGGPAGPGGFDGPTYGSGPGAGPGSGPGDGYGSPPPPPLGGDPPRSP